MWMWETIQSRFAHAVTKDAVFEICKLLCTKSQLKTCFQLQKTSVFTPKLFIRARKNL